MIAFSGVGGDYILVEEDPAQVAELLDGTGRLVRLQRIPAPVSEEPIAGLVGRLFEG